MTMLNISVGIIALCNIVLLLGLAYLAVTIRNTIKKADRVVDKVEEKTDKIMTVAEDTIRKVSSRVDSTTKIAHESVINPLISISSVLAGVSKAAEILIKPCEQKKETEKKSKK